MAGQIRIHNILEGMRMKQEPVQFVARDEQGKEYTITAYPCQNVKPSFQGGMSVEFTGAYHRVTQDGDFVTWLKDGRYRLEPIGSILTSDDPKAV